MKSTVKETKYVVKGAAPWYNNSNDAKYRWPDRDKVTDVDVSVSGQATVTCKEVTDMILMFFDCPHITKLDVSNLNTSKVIYMNFMFDNCSKLTELDLSGFVTSKVTNMSYMFDNCSNLTTIKGVLDMKSCEYYENMFHNCPKLRGVKIKNPPVDFESVSGLSNSQYIVVS